MIADHTNLYSEGVPHPFTLNDLRVHNVYEEEPARNAVLTRSAMFAAAVLAIGAFVWLDPLRLFTPTEQNTQVTPSVASTEPPLPPARQEVAAPEPPTPVPATKSVELPAAPAPTVRAAQAPAPVVRSPVAATKPQSGPHPADKANSTLARARVEENMAPPVVVTSPAENTTAPASLVDSGAKTPPPAPLANTEEKPIAPIAPKPADDTKTAPKPAAATEPAPATE